MSLIKIKITKHLMIKDDFSEYQAGFTKGRKIENNLLILKYCVEESIKIKNPLLVVSIDFAKAFDSITREHIRSLRKYKCDPACDYR